MKKFFSMMAAVAAMFAFAACGSEPEANQKPAEPTQLEKPVVTVKEKGETSFTIEWNAVPNATSYQIFFNSKSLPTTETSYTFENLNAGTYAPRVKALAEGYVDSDYSDKVEIELTGATTADWFTQELFLGVKEDEGMTKFNTVFFTWKGTDVADIQYYLATAEEVESLTETDIKALLNGIGEENIKGVIDAVNSAEGFTSAFGPGLYGSTTYVLYALAVNSKGVEFFTKNEVTTEETVVPEEVKAWFGTYSAKTTKMIDLNAQDKASAVSDKDTEFTFSIDLIEGSADEVLVDGISTLGEGAPAVGQIVMDENGNNLLYLWNYASLGSIGDGLYAVWYALADTMGDHYFVGGEYPAYTLTLNNDGSIAFQLYEGTLTNNEPFAVVAFDIAAVDSSYTLQGFYDTNWKYGEWTNIAKADATPAAQSKKALNNAIKPCAVSVVYAM